MRLDRRFLTSGTVVVVIVLVVFIGSEGLRRFDAALASYLSGTLAGYFSLPVFASSVAAPALGAEVTGGRVGGAAALPDPPDAIPAVGVDAGRGGVHGAGS
jgi:hypothetical protein